MRTIIAGSRGIVLFEILELAIKKAPFEVTTVISGGADGVDKMGENYAKKHKLPVEVFLPDWAKHGKAAGPIRNRQMADNAEALLALWDGVSRGTKNMIEEAKARNLHVYVYLCPAEK